MINKEMQTMSLSKNYDFSWLSFPDLFGESNRFWIVRSSRTMTIYEFLYKLQDIKLSQSEAFMN